MAESTTPRTQTCAHRKTAGGRARTDHRAARTALSSPRVFQRHRLRLSPQALCGPKAPCTERGALPDTPEASALRPRAGGPRSLRGARTGCVAPAALGP